MIITCDFNATDYENEPIKTSFELGEVDSTGTRLVASSNEQDDEPRSRKKRGITSITLCPTAGFGRTILSPLSSLPGMTGRTETSPTSGQETLISKPSVFDGSIKYILSNRLK